MRPNTWAEGKKGRKERRGGTGTTAYPHRRRPIHHGLPTHTAAGTCGSSGIQVLQADNANGARAGLRELAAAGRSAGSAPPSERNNIAVLSEWRVEPGRESEAA
jgi:hypothetical protein